jgi:hypothetical protein
MLVDFFKLTILYSRMSRTLEFLSFQQGLDFYDFSKR